MRLKDVEPIIRELQDEEQYGADYYLPIELLKSAPTIEAKPVVHAHWEWVKIEDGESYFEIAECSNCRGQSAREYQYCRHCGAQMDELVSKADELNHIAEVGKKEPISQTHENGVKIPVISMEDVPKLAKEMKK